MADFNNTDVNVPADLVVDGKTYHKLACTFVECLHSEWCQLVTSDHSMYLSTLRTRSKNYTGERLSIFLIRMKTLASSTQFCISRRHRNTPSRRVANLVHVVINGEWGLYVNAEQFNKEFIEARFETSKGSRWKVPEAQVDEAAWSMLAMTMQPTRERFRSRARIRKKHGMRLVELCRVLNTNSSRRVASKIESILDIEGTLAFLALDVALINSDGYWVRASDYCLYRDPKECSVVLSFRCKRNVETCDGTGHRRRTRHGGGDLVAVGVANKLEVRATQARADLKGDRGAVDKADLDKVAPEVDLEVDLRTGSQHGWSIGCGARSIGRDR